VLKLKRFILVILDGFGIGYTDDVDKVRPQDMGANTCKHILERMPDLKLPNLERLGLMNALGIESGVMKKSPLAVYGKSGLAHFGADTFYGHQEIMGTRPRKPVKEAFSSSIDNVEAALLEAGYSVEYMGDSHKFLFVNGSAAVADNIEADPGSAYNVTASLDLMDYSEVVNIGKVVRNVVEVSRVIAFGGEDVTADDILSAAEVKEDKFIGINAPKSGVYNKGYRCVHLGYGIDPNVQVPTILGRLGINVTLIGKVADIVENEYGRSIPCVDTKETMELTVKEVESRDSGFTAVNVQETDLMGHAQDTEGYAEKLIIADRYIGDIMEIMDGEDIMIVMADHGNDPTIGHSHHTRENVPILIYGRKIKSKYIGHRRTMSDVGATVAEYFSSPACENGTSFLKEILG
jgi:phosphopentomutase